MADPRQARLRTGARIAARFVALAVLGAMVGAVAALLTPARLEIAGSDARIWLEPGQTYDQLGVSGILTGKLATTRTVLGEALGVRGELDIDASELTDSTGAFNIDVLPAYIQAYSDPAQLITDVRHALVVHFVVDALIGAAAALAACSALLAYRSWRRRYDLVHWPGVGAQVRAYRAPERALLFRAAFLVALALVLNAVPSSTYRHSRGDVVVGDPALASTPLAGLEVAGLLRPALVAVQNYIETYFAQTNTYYDQLRDAVDAYLRANPVELPSGADVTQLGFVTDRHCNIGMDRVIVDVLKHFDIHTLVSAGDDAFSGSFGFESACTRNLADKSAQNDITDVFVGGNHDSPATIAAQAEQGIKTLTGDVVEVHGLRFLGSPDPRTSRYGQGIVPSDRQAQDDLLTEQGTAIGRTACAGAGPLIAVAHDPLAGTTALHEGCGHVTIALDGHTHSEGDPVAVSLADDATGHQVTGGSAGGAPGENAVERSLASSVTVGPLNHDAWINIVSVNPSTGALVGVTEFHFTPSRSVTVTQQLVG